jgi:hypothetical protein
MCTFKSIFRLSIIGFSVLTLLSCAGDKSKKDATKKDELSQTADKVMVFKGKGAVQCESSGESMEASREVLIKAGIDVLFSTCGFQTGVSTMAVCGAGTTSINIHTLPAGNLEDAEKLGYFPVSRLINTELGLGYTASECRE